VRPTPERPCRVVILGAGFAGLELATRLSEGLAENVRITLIDKNDSFVFGFSKLDVMFGSAALEDVRYPYSMIVNPVIDFRQETVLSIDPSHKLVVTNAGSYEADVLVIALGADTVPAATPGLVRFGDEFYSPEGAARIAGRLEQFRSGVAVIGVLGPFFKCPPAPNEAALMLHQYLTDRGIRDAVTIHLVSPLSSPIPISEETSAAIVSMLTDRGIHYWPNTRISRVDGTNRMLHMDDGRTLRYDLLLGVPVHQAPAVVGAAGLTDDGWIPVDPATFATRFDHVYAVGDITNAPVPRAGSIAEGEAATLADVLIAELTGAPAPPPYAGDAICYIETGRQGVARVDVNFLSQAVPTARFQAPSASFSREKRGSAAFRARRWFGAPRRPSQPEAPQVRHASVAPRPAGAPSE
jgi:sulfide:quinone oxidoreductase